QLGLIRYYGKILKDQGSWGDSEQPFREALELRSRIGDPRELAESLFHVGLVEQQSGRADAARGRFEEADLRAKERGNQLILAECERHLGGDAEERQDFAAALAHYRRALEIVERAGEEAGLSPALNSVGEMVLRQDPAAALPTFEKALAHAERLGDTAYI